jgi:hypothetical protein
MIYYKSSLTFRATEDGKVSLAPVLRFSSTGAARDGFERRERPEVEVVALAEVGIYLV